ncbi:MAG: hypothetical protein V3V31_00420 [Methylococcales bacterium]
MNKAFVKEYGLPLLLLALCLFFALFAFGEWLFIDKQHHTKMRVINNTGRGEIVLDELPSESFLLPGISEYSEMIEHPLFIEGRMPIEESDMVEPVIAARADLKMKYMGYISTPEGEFGMFLDETIRKYRKLEKGTMVEGWRVDALYPDRATLMQGGSKEELPLHKPKPKIAPRIRPKSKSKSPFERNQANRRVAREKSANLRTHDK